jgi:hypothetical protein
MNAETPKALLYIANGKSPKGSTSQPQLTKSKKSNPQKIPIHKNSNDERSVGSEQLIGIFTSID